MSLCIKPFSGTQKAGGEVSLIFQIYRDHKCWVKGNIVMGMRTKVSLVPKFINLEEEQPSQRRCGAQW